LLVLGKPKYHGKNPVGAQKRIITLITYKNVTYRYEPGKHWWKASTLTKKTVSFELKIPIGSCPLVLFRDQGISSILQNKRNKFSMATLTLRKISSINSNSS